MNMTEIEKTINTKNNGVVSYKVSRATAANSNEYKSSGSQIAVLLLHGLASNMTRWTEFVATSALTACVDIIRMDLRGHGNSMNYDRISTWDWCEDIHQIIIQEKYNKLVIIGHSLGAQIAMQFAFKKSEYVKGLVLIDPVFPLALKGSLNITRRFRYVLLCIIYALLLKSKLGFNKKNIPYRDLHALDIKTREILNSNTGGNIAELYMNPFEDLVYIPFVNYCQDMFEVSRKIPKLRQILSPVLCLLSKGATVSNIELTKWHITQFPNSSIQVIDANHWLLTEKPTESKDAIDNWVLDILNKS